MISQTDKASRIFWEAVVSAVPPERNIVKYVSDKLLPYCLENKMIVFFSWSACSLCKDLSDESVGQARIILRFGLLTSLLFIFPGANRDKEYVFRNNCLYVTFSLYTFEPVIRYRYESTAFDFAAGSRTSRDPGRRNGTTAQVRRRRKIQDHTVY